MLFINPSINPRSQPPLISSFVYTTFPTGIGFLAGYLRGKCGAPVAILDGHIRAITDRMLEDALRAEPEPRIVGFSCLTINAKNAFELARRVKEIDPRAVTVFGGIHPTVLPEECLRRGGVDVVVRGEGEETLAELHARVVAGRDYGDIRGISILRGGEVVHNPARELIPDLDEIPPFPYDLFEKDMEAYRDFGTIITSRGCPHRCIFCSQRAVSGGRFRYLSTERVIQEIDLLVHAYGQTRIWFNEDNFAVSIPRFNALLDAIIARRYDRSVGFLAELRADSITPALLAKFREANFTMLAFGAETSSERLMKLIRKGETVEANNRAIRMAHDAGIRVCTTYIFGLPTETRAERRETFRLSRRLPLDNVRFNTAIPYPGTELYEIAAREGRLTVKEDWENFNVQYYLISDDIPYVPEGEDRYALIRDTMLANLRSYVNLKGLKSLFSSPLSGGGVLSIPKRWGARDVGRVLAFAWLVARRFVAVSCRAAAARLRRGIR